MMMDSFCFFFPYSGGWEKCTKHTPYIPTIHHAPPFHTHQHVEKTVVSLVHSMKRNPVLHQCVIWCWKIQWAHCLKRQSHLVCTSRKVLGNYTVGTQPVGKLIAINGHGSYLVALGTYNKL